MRILLTIFAILFSLAASAQKIETVEGEYTYYAPENVTLEQARRTALTRAQTQAIADAFGTNVTQSDITRIENKDGKSSVDMLSLGGVEVKGEWLETIGEPEYGIRYEGNMLVVTCRVKGKAREIVSSDIDFTARILRNGREAKYESDQFRSGDDLYLLFQSPVSGYLAVYLVDAEDQAFCLLPYRNQYDGIYQVKANQRYLFFDEKSAPAQEKMLVDEYVMTTERSSEHNQVYVIFSPNQFAKATDSSIDEGLPRELNAKDFQRWLAKCRKRDKDMNLRMTPITIEK
ncbi:MAG: DUF4384 domain-containing protein [Prevotella sp.]|nr:DUF4384 domain-containing protein [Prevotella sp.]MBR4650899.1 DUF4384 domain-containing protein [Prevotella sp.]